MIAEDPFIWLEEVEGEAALGWVRRENARSLAALQADPRFSAYRRDALAIAAAPDRIPYARFLGERLANFWQDAAHQRGVWRATSLASYLSAEPDWRTLLDIDALAAAEGRPWVYHGAAVLPPGYRRALVSLSDGGKDAAEAREFDIAAAAFVADGFFLPEGKQSAAWFDADTLLVAREWGPGTLTRSGYPFVLKRWRRGTPLAAAEELFAGTPDDVSVGAEVLRDPDGAVEGVLVNRQVDFFRGEHCLLTPSGPLRLPLPGRSSFRAFVAGRLIFSLEEAWRGFAAGALVSLELAACLAGPEAAPPQLIVAPGPREAIEAVAATRSRLLVALYRDVQGSISAYRCDNGRWLAASLPLPDRASLHVIATNRRDDCAFIGAAGFTTPDTLYLADAAAATVQPIKSLPAQFDASGCVVEQFEARSRDGTLVPYFVVRRGARPAPTLLYGYGGFQVSLTPSYAALVGKLWIEQGGVYAVANIRGGGEFGPRWHEAALQRDRQRAFDDFIAVAEDLVARGVTAPRRLGIMGGSNGGLLMGAMLVQRPELFRAAVIQVPLLDMLRYHKLLAGASWIAEYGDPEKPAEAEFLRRISPYHNLRPGVLYPEPLFVTSTRDDRVHPGHARKMAAKMAAMGRPFLYYENTEGGHAAAATLEERARRQALEFTYLAEKLMD